ncbi:hypothetical protein KC19_11G104000 [Ceratodon purpureus]|uniref:Uncharacterized protein n=1 Tax=Ceratodon purpureus TaxID=3225 RepID=A0A8T0GDM0_CERPU|nr:hypothetical protein KC19_11G104000 [Ceratodon purpureus]
MLGSLGVAQFRAPEGAHYGGVAVGASAERGMVVENFGFSELGYGGGGGGGGGGGELARAREGFVQGSGGGDPVEVAEEEPDIGLEEFFGVMQEDLGVAQEKLQEVEAPPGMNGEMGFPDTMLGLGPPLSHMEPEIAPNTPAVPEAHYDAIAPPVANEAAQELSWHHDLNGSGEGFESTSEEGLSVDNATQFLSAFEDFPSVDYERPQQKDGSVRASNWTYPETLSPDVSRPSRSNSSSPIAMLDSFNFSRPEHRLGSPFERNSIVQNRNSSIPNGLTIVDLSDDSDGDEEESELREIEMVRGKRKLPSWATGAGGERKRPREGMGHIQPGGHQYSALSNPFAQFAKKPAEMNHFSNRSRSWEHNSMRHPSQLGNLESSVTTATSLRGMPGVEAQRGTSAYRETYATSMMSMAKRTSSGEVSTSYERAALRVLPGTMSAYSGMANGMRLAAAADQRLSVAVDPMKRSEELAHQAVFQAFALGDEQEESTPDEGLLTMTLLKHQRIALSWMVNRESGRSEPCGGILADDQGLGKTISTISLILKNRAPVRKASSSGAELLDVEASTVDLDGDEDDDVPAVFEKKQDAGNWAISTFSPNGSLSQPDDPGAIRLRKGRPAAGTLVVCPTSVLRQWAQEIRDKVTSEADLTVLVYHGSNRIKDPQEIAKYDVVLSTYSIVSMEVPKQALPEEKEEESRRAAFEQHGFIPFQKPKKEKPTKKPKKEKVGVDADGFSLDAGPLARVAWFRVVLDEAQSIKNHRTQVARAAWGLRAKRRWCLSGTPIQNSIDDLFSYFRFLRYCPWDVYKKFQHDIKDPVSRNPNEGYKKLQAILKPIVLRRTKTSFIDGKPIVNLPPRIVKLQQSEFSMDERFFYSNLETESRAQFQEYARAGTVQSNYVNILWMLLRLRQACDHPMLVKKSVKSESFQKTTLEAIRKLPPPQRAELIQCLEGSRTICHICQDAPEEPVVSICAHVFCRQCISEQMANGDDTTCRFPKCKRGLNSSLLFTLAALKNPNVDGGSGSIVNGEPLAEIEPVWNTSSKIDAVINTLQALPKISVLVEDGKIVKGPKAEKLLKMEASQMDGGEAASSIVPVASESAIVPVASESSIVPVASEITGSIVEKVDSTEKAIVFSQWTSMLDLLEQPLKQAGFCYRRLDGTMSVVARDRAVSDFNTLPEVWSFVTPEGFVVSVF